MASWYEKAVFYHIYPLGMLGAPFANTEDAAADRFPELDKWVCPHGSLRLHRTLHRTAL